MIDSRLLLTPAGRIRTNTGRGVCRLGAIAFDERGSCFGLTARHVLECEEAGGLYDAVSNVKIGRRVPSSPAHGVRPFFNTIGMFRIDTAKIEARMATPHRVVQEIASAENLIRATIFKLDGSSSLQRGTITGVGGWIRFLNPFDKSASILTDVLEMRFDSGGPDPVSSGEAGSLMIDDRDRAVGLLMCGHRDECYVAPLAPFLEANGLRMAAGKIASSSEHGSDVRGYVDELGRATSGGHRMSAMLRAERGIHEDPEGDNVPDAILERLRGSV